MVCGLPNCLLSAPSSRERHGPFDFTAITICSLLWFMSRFTTGLYIYESLEVDCVVQGCFVDTGGVPCSYRPSQSHTSSVKREEKTQERAKSCGSDPQIGTEGWHNRSGTQCKSSYPVCYFFFSTPNHPNHSHQLTNYISLCFAQYFFHAYWVLDIGYAPKGLTWLFPE